MAIDFKSMKSNRAAAVETLTKKLTSTNNFQNNNEDDGTEWKLVRGKDGNGSAVIRFLPASPGEEDPFVIVYDHWFQGPTGKYYIENSLSTIGRSDDPVYILNTAAYAAGDKLGAKSRARRTSYWSNIYVVKDPNDPENEGKVFKFRYGKKIFDMIKACATPDPEEDGLDEPKVLFDPFDLWTGANFRLKATTVQVNGKPMPNYDGSKFTSCGPLLDDDKKLEAIWNSQYKLQDFLKPELFKTVEELQKRLNFVMGIDAGATSRSVESLIDADDEPVPTAKPTTSKKAVAKPAPAEEVEPDEEAWFRDLGLDDDA